MTLSTRRRKNPLEILRAAVVACRRCPRLVTYREQAARVKVRRYRDEDYWGKPLPGFGDSEARLLVVGLAPAAHGGNRTGRIFTGDRSGDFLYQALYRAGFANQPLSRHRDDGLALRDCYITAAVRCAPPDNKPSLIELSTCRPYLIEEIGQLSHLRVVVTLGHIAFTAFLKAWGDVGRSVPSPRPFFAHGAKNILAAGVVLLASYHPSQQNTQTGRLTSVMFQRVFTAARRLLAEPRAQKEARPRMV